MPAETSAIAGKVGSRRAVVVSLRNDWRLKGDLFVLKAFREDFTDGRGRR